MINSKYLISILLSFGILFSFTTISKAEFTDQTDVQYKDALEYVTENEIVSGFSDNTFRPTSEITRAEFTKILINTKYPEEEINNCTDKSFPDINSENKFLNFICIAKKNEVVSGFTNGDFKPDDNITIAEASKIISNAYEFKTTPLDNEYKKFLPYINAIEQRQAYAPDMGNIYNNINREQLIEMIYLLDNNIPAELPTTYIEKLNEADGWEALYLVNNMYEKLRGEEKFTMHFEADSDFGMIFIDFFSDSNSRKSFYTEKLKGGELYEGYETFWDNNIKYTKVYNLHYAMKPNISNATEIAEKLYVETFSMKWDPISGISRAHPDTTTNIFIQNPNNPIFYANIKNDDQYTYIEFDNGHKANREKYSKTIFTLDLKNRPISYIHNEIKINFDYDKDFEIELPL